MYNPEILRFFEIALEGVIEATLLISKQYKNNNIQVSYKEDNTPVTELDKQADAILRKHLALTELPIISEEFEIPEYATRKNYRRYWLVDPLDGTKDYVAQNGEFTVNVALIDDGRVVAGLVSVPCTNEVYFGGSQYNSVKYQGDLNELDFDELLLGGDRLPLLKNEKPVVVCSRTAKKSDLKQQANRYFPDNNFEVKQVGSSLKLCWLAEGKADLYIRQSPCMEWDIAAGQAIVEGAGKRVIDFHNNMTLKYNKESLLSSWFIAM